MTGGGGMRFSENRRLAAMALAAVAVLSIFISGGLGLSGERSRALAVYDSEKNVRSDLADRAEFAYRLAKAVEGGDGVSEESVSGALAARDALIEALEGGDQISLYEANAALAAAVESLWGQIAASGVGDDDKAFASGQYAEFLSAGSTIARSAFNGLAEEFNALLGRFPASSIGRVCGVRELRAFG